MLQHQLELKDDDCADRSNLMTAMEVINGRYGKGTVHVASTGATEKVREWGTPQYTTKWEDVPIARA
ncbi:DUF4113 domain-containing protein [Acidovorax sp.]|uniref:DUF4113 domain-containing protein n=1 Tax=Acidovorax sp. TaxID=1872122 RepID=UPI003D014E65